jgi:predicted CXXCH cytochrome family protein
MAHWGLSGELPARAGLVAASLLMVLGLLRPAPANIVSDQDYKSKEVGDCLSCHNFDPVLSHPVDVSPSMAVPRDLPLLNGKVSCTSCHNAPAGHGETRAARASVRGSAGGLCAQCHKDKGDKNVGHFSSGALPAHLVRSGEVMRGQADRESTACLACHDGAAAEDAGDIPGYRKSMHLDGSHPIGVRYGERRDISLVDRDRLDRRVRLFGQEIGCGSCHSPYSKVDKLLVISNLKSRLCLSCHVE